MGDEIKSGQTLEFANKAKADEKTTVKSAYESTYEPITEVSAKDKKKKQSKNKDKMLRFCDNHKQERKQ